MEVPIDALKLLWKLWVKLCETLLGPLAPLLGRDLINGFAALLLFTIAYLVIRKSEKLFLAFLWLFYIGLAVAKVIGP